MKNIRNSISERERAALCDSIREQLCKTSAYKKSGCIFTYISMKSEVDTRKMIRQAWQDGKRVFSPKVEGKGMEFLEIFSMEGLVESKFGVLEPNGEKQSLRPGLISKKLKETKLMLIPGLAFDLSGNRIGYGAGYYDRYLAKHSEEEFVKIALAFDFQVMDQIASYDNDIKVNGIITPTRVIQCK